jgi:CheY-like chemotaxis protein
VIAVRDNGSGIAPEHLGRIFEPFFTTKPVGKGTGLGLAMVYGFVKQSGGHVTLHSERGAGTTVKLYLPLAAPPVAREPESPGPALESGGDESILLVEDNDLVRHTARRHLLALGYRVTEAANAAQALDLLRAAARIDLLLTDIVMPEIQGPELARKAREMRPGLKVLFTSGFAGDAALEGGGLAARAPFLAKPYQRPELARKVRSALDGE